MARTRVLMFGNCQTTIAARTLVRTPAFTDRYVLAQSRPQLPEQDDPEAFRSAELLIVQNIGDWRRHRFAHLIPEGIPVISLPFLRVGALWPFQTKLNPLHGEFDERRPDDLLDRLAGLVADPEARVQAYVNFSSPVVPDLATVARIPDITALATLEEARILREDAVTGSGLGRYVVDSYRQIRLFHTLQHPAAPLMRQIVAELMAKLGVPPETMHEDLLDHYIERQVPIHPKVIEALGLKWVTPDTVYRVGGQDRTFEQHLRDRVLTAMAA